MTGIPSRPPKLDNFGRDPRDCMRLSELRAILAEGEARERAAARRAAPGRSPEIRGGGFRIAPQVEQLFAPPASFWRRVGGVLRLVPIRLWFARDRRAYALARRREAGRLNSAAELMRVFGHALALFGIAAAEVAAVVGASRMFK